MARFGSLVLGVIVLMGPVASAQPAAEIAEVVRTEGNLRRGAEGAAVRAVQSRLVALGYGLGVDGEFGPRTEAAVRAFQRAQDLAADGVVGPRTAARLDAPAAARRDVPPTGDTVGARGVLASESGRTRRPEPRSTPAQARAAALGWARQARAQGVHILVIAYEGLWSFSPDHVAQVYAYHAALRRGARPAAPTRARMSFLSKQLLVPRLAEHAADLDLLLMPETSERGEASVAAETARAWHQVHGRDLRLIVLGHSFGGYAALRLTQRLEAAGVEVAELVTLDARTTPGNYRRFVTPSNVRRHHNYFQKGFLPGYEIRGAVNQRVGPISHGKLPSEPTVQAHVARILGP